MTTIHTAIDIGSILLSLTLALLYFRFSSKAAEWAKVHGQLAVDLTQAVYRGERMAIDFERVMRAANKVHETWIREHRADELERDFDALIKLLGELAADAKLRKAYELIGGKADGPPGTIIESEPKP